MSCTDLDDIQWEAGFGHLSHRMAQGADQAVVEVPVGEVRASFPVIHPRVVEGLLEVRWLVIAGAAREQAPIGTVAGSVDGIGHDKPGGIADLLFDEDGFNAESAVSDPILSVTVSDPAVSVRNDHS